MQSQDTIADPNWDLESEYWNFPQDTRAVSFPFWMVKEIALDLEEKSLLEVQVELLELETGTYSLLVQGLEKEQVNKQLQLELLQKNQQLLQSQLKAVKNRKPKPQDLKWLLRMAAALGTGYMLGNLNK